VKNSAQKNGSKKMKKKFYWTLAGMAAALQFASAEDIVIFDAASKTNTLQDTAAAHPAEGGFVPLGSGLEFKGNWDLSQNRNIAVELENTGMERSCLQLSLFDDDAKKARERNAYMRVNIDPNEKGVFLIPIPKPLAHPEILDKMKGMRNDPFDRCNRGALPDLSKVKRISLSIAWTNRDALRKVSVRKVTALDTSKEKLPEYFNMTPDEFFPFIDKYGQFKFKEWPDKIRSDADLKKAAALEAEDLAAHAEPSGRDKFGGWADGPQLKATGRFRVEKLDGKWWMVDPEGRLYWSHGVVRVTPSSGITPLDGRKSYFEGLPSADDKFAIFYSTKDELLAPYYDQEGIKETFDFSAANIFRKYGDNWRAKYAELAHKRLKSWGLNTIANSSDRQIFMMRQTPYIDRIETRAPSFKPFSRQWWPFADPFSEEFRKNLRTRLEQEKASVSDPWCIGLFVDNEIQWGDTADLAKAALRTSGNCAAKLKFAEELKAKYKTVGALNSAWKSDYADWNDLLNRGEVPEGADKKDLEKFNSEIVDKYFKTVREEVKRAAPDILYMGCRFAGVNKTVLDAAVKYCDVMSFNIYADNIARLTPPKGADKPIIIGEFHFGATSDTGKFHPSLVMCKNQKERAKSYAEYVESALRNPYVIGTHWHQFSDQATTGRFDGENFQVGFTDICDTPYPDTIAALRKVGYDMYKTRSGK